jgi:hypothetical protein
MIKMEGNKKKWQEINEIKKKWIQNYRTWIEIKKKLMENKLI